MALLKIRAGRFSLAWQRSAWQDFCNFVGLVKDLTNTVYCRWQFQIWNEMMTVHKLLPSLLFAVDLSGYIKKGFDKYSNGAVSYCIHTQYTLGFSKHYKHKTNLAHLSCSLYTKWRNDSWKFTSCGDLVWSSVHTVKDSVWSPAHTVRDSVWSPVHTVRDSVWSPVHTVRYSVWSPVHTARDSVWNYVLYCKRFSL